VHAEQTELADLGEEFLWQHSGLEPVSDVGQDPVGSELADRVADQALFVVELVVDAEHVSGRGVRAARYGSILSGSVGSVRSVGSVGSASPLAYSRACRRWVARTAEWATPGGLAQIEERRLRHAHQSVCLADPD
jgi:hypothetical protein